MFQVFLKLRHSEIEVPQWQGKGQMHEGTIGQTQCNKRQGDIGR